MHGLEIDFIRIHCLKIIRLKYCVPSNKNVAMNTRL